MEHAEDMAQVFIDAARARPERAGAYDVGGNTVTVERIVAAITQAAPEMDGKITFNPAPLTVSPEQVDAPLRALLGELHWRPLEEGVQQTVEHFRRAVQNGRIDVERAIS